MSCKSPNFPYFDCKNLIFMLNFNDSGKILDTLLLIHGIENWNWYIYLLCVLVLTEIFTVSDILCFLELKGMVFMIIELESY